MRLLQVLWLCWTTFVVVVLMQRVGDAGARSHNTHLAARPHTTSTLDLLTKALTKEEVVEEEAALLEEEEGALLEVLVLVEKVRERNVLERIKRETPLENGRPASGHGGHTPTLHMVVIHGSQWGGLLLVVSLGVCIGLLGGVLLILTGACCYLKCRPGGGLDLGQKHSTYRSADVIDEVL